MSRKQTTDKNLKFKFRTGWVHLLADEIRMTESENEDSKLIEISGLGKLQSIMFGVLAVVSFIYYWDMYQAKNYTMAIMMLLFCSFLVIGILNRRAQSLSPIIFRSQIKKVEFTKEVPFFSAPYIIIYHEEKGKVKKSFIAIEKEKEKEILSMLRKEKLFA